MKGQEDTMASCRSWKRQTHYPLEPPEGMHLCHHLDFSLVDLCRTSKLQNCKIIHVCCFKHWVRGYLFIYLFRLCRVLVAAHGIFVVACRISQLWHADSQLWQAGVLVAACRFLSCGMQTLSCGMRTLSCGMHTGSSFPTRNQTQAPCFGRVESYSLDHQGSPCGNLLEQQQEPIHQLSSIHSCKHECQLYLNLYLDSDIILCHKCQLLYLGL